MFGHLNYKEVFTDQKSKRGKCINLFVELYEWKGFIRMEQEQLNNKLYSHPDLQGNNLDFPLVLTDGNENYSFELQPRTQSRRVFRMRMTLGETVK